MGRFINADAMVSTGQGILGNNMFSYCENNPICKLDPSGYISSDMSVNAYILGNAGKKIVIPPQDSHGLISGMINGQGTFQYASEGIGLGSYASSGCAIIAIESMQKIFEFKPKKQQKTG